MTTGTTATPGRAREPRYGLVLGGGGVLGAAWTTGALAALEQETGWDPRGAELTVGTSVGSVLAALLGAGAPVSDLSEHHRGRAPATGPLAGHDLDYETVVGRGVPPAPRPRLGSGRLLARSAPRLRRFPPLAVLSALAPLGRSSVAAVGGLVEALVGDGGWPDGIQVVAMDYATGRRVPFGRSDAPPAPVPDAVMASCAIPGWFRPVTIGGRRYVDGGVCSMTNADLAAREGLDRIYILAPMATHGLDRPSSTAARLERRLRRAVTRRLASEIGKIAHTGVPVTVLTPGPEDLAAMGANVMNPRHRHTVLETSLRTSTRTLRARGNGQRSP